MFKMTAIVALLIVGNHIVNAFDCCICAKSEAGCVTVASGCMYIGNDEAALAESQGDVCVTPSWYACAMNGICPAPPAVPPAPSDCKLDPCDNNEATYNVGFIVDESGSVGKDDYVLTLEYFVKKMIKENLNEDSLVSFLSFASNNDRNWLFTDKGGASMTNREGVLGAVEKEKDNYSGSSTCLGNAVSEMITDYTEDLPKVPLAERGDNNIIFILTDGMPTCAADCADIAKQLRDNEIVTYIVGITSNFSPKLVECLVEDQIDPNDDRYDETKTSVDDYILTIPKFDVKEFYQLEIQLRDTVCPPPAFDKEDGLVNELYVVLSSANDMINENLFFVISFIFIIIGALVYGLKERHCSKNDHVKYMPLKAGFHGRYYQTV